MTRPFAVARFTRFIWLASLAFAVGAWAGELKTDTTVSHTGTTTVTEEVTSENFGTAAAPDWKRIERRETSERPDADDSTTTHRTVNITRYEGGSQRATEVTTVEETEGLVPGGERLIKSRTASSRFYTTTKPRTLISTVTETVTLAEMEDTGRPDENGDPVLTGRPIHQGRRVTTTGGVTKIEVMGPRSQQWVSEAEAAKEARRIAEERGEPGAGEPNRNMGDEPSHDTYAGNTAYDALPQNKRNTSDFLSLGATLNGGFMAQRLPTENVRLGVIGAGVDDKPLLGVTTVLYTGYTTSSGYLGEVPLGGPLKLKVNVGFGYGRGEDKRERDVDGQPGISNGLNYWGYSQNGSPGLSSNGAGAWGDTRSTFQNFDVNMAGKIGFPCGGDYDDEGPSLRVNLPGFDVATTYLELGAAFSHTTLDTDQNFRLTQDNPGFSQFDVSSKTKVDSTDWRIGALIGVYHTRPVPKLDNWAFSIGAATMLGYHDSKADASQHNECDIRFEGEPGVNVCNMYQRDFRLNFDLHESGFDYDVRGMVRVDYKFDAMLDGLRVGLVYNVRYSGISQFDAPVNLDQEGPAKLEWRHVVGHQAGLQLTYAF